VTSPLGSFLLFLGIVVSVVRSVGVERRMRGRIRSDLLLGRKWRIEEVGWRVDGRSCKAFFCSEGYEGRVPGVGRDARVALLRGWEVEEA
jgi:hypothetical protein